MSLQQRDFSCPGRTSPCCLATISSPHLVWVLSVMNWTDNPEVAPGCVSPGNHRPKGWERWPPDPRHHFPSCGRNGLDSPLLLARGNRSGQQSLATRYRISRTLHSVTQTLHGGFSPSLKYALSSLIFSEAPGLTVQGPSLAPKAAWMSFRNFLERLACC